MARSPCSFTSPCCFPLLPFFIPLLLTWKPSLLWQDPVHLGLRLLVNWPPPFSTPPHSLPIPSPFQIPSTQVNCAPHYDDFKIPASPVRNKSEHPLDCVFILYGCDCRCFDCDHCFFSFRRINHVELNHLHWFSVYTLLIITFRTKGIVSRDWDWPEWAVHENKIFDMTVQLSWAKLKTIF